MDYLMLRDLIKKLEFEELFISTDIENIRIYTTEISRPGLQMTGYYEKFVPERVQIIGSAEWHYLSDLSDEDRVKALDKFFSYPIPLVIISRSLQLLPELMDAAKKYNRTLVRSNKTTSKVINDLVDYISYSLAPGTNLHGVMLEVFGMGVMITGKSGVGKSETALDLITRGCRLVADDVVEVKRVENAIRAQCPELIRHFLEIRGVGILDIERIYGIGAVKQFDYLDMVVELETWDPNKEYDRIGLDEETIEILGIKFPKVTIPVKPGRNIAMIVEVAAKNMRQKRLGYNAAEELNKRVLKSIEERKASKTLG